MNALAATMTPRVNLWGVASDLDILGPVRYRLNDIVVTSASELVAVVDARAEVRAVRREGQLWRVDRASGAATLWVGGLRGGDLDPVVIGG